MNNDNATETDEEDPKLLGNSILSGDQILLALKRIEESQGALGHIMESVARSQAIAESVMSAGKAAERFAEYFANINERLPGASQLVQLERRISETFTFLENNRARIFSFIPLLDGFEANRRRVFVEKLRQYEWWITPSMPTDQLMDAIIAGKKKTDIKRIVINHFSVTRFKNLNTMVKGWMQNPLINVRAHLIKQALRAHKRGDYAASIALLLPQIEGIAGDYIAANPDLFRKVNKNSPKEKVHAAIDTIPVDDIVPEVEALLAYIQESAYEKTRNGAQAKSTFNRHKILHGEQIRYGTCANSLRAFLLIDALSKLGSEDMPE
jgi:hypothetical protein